MWCRSSSRSLPRSRRWPLELDRPVGQLHPWEDTRPARDHVVSPQADPLPQYRPGRDLAARSDLAARPDDAVAKLAALAHLAAGKDNGALDGAVGADRDVLGEHHERADVGARCDLRPGLDDRRWDHAPVELDVRRDPRPAYGEALGDGRLDVALDDVEGPLEVALGRADVHPVALGGVAVEALAHQPRPDLTLDRDVPLRRHQVEDLPLEHVGTGTDQRAAGPARIHAARRAVGARLLDERLH